jgi:beta-glucosidase
MQTNLDSWPSPSDAFLWGVATSGYQSEGGFNGFAQPQNNWALSEQRGSVMTVGKAADFWNCYDDDFRACREMGLNSFRIGLEGTDSTNDPDPDGGSARVRSPGAG